MCLGDDGTFLFFWEIARSLGFFLQKSRISQPNLFKLNFTDYLFICRLRNICYWKFSFNVFFANSHVFPSQIDFFIFCSKLILGCHKVWCFWGEVSYVICWKFLELFLRYIFYKNRTMVGNVKEFDSNFIMAIERPIFN
jgi:hypothetical protein